MDAPAILADFRRRGIRLRLEGNRLIATPASLLSSDDADHIRAHKPAIVALLAPPAGPRLIVPLRTRCVSCGAALQPGSAVRCPGCVDAAVLARDQRRRDEGRAPP